VSRAVCPNRILREAGLLAVAATPHGELIDFERSAAWCLADHQIGHVYLQLGLPREKRDALVGRIGELFSGRPGIGRVITGRGLVEAGLSATPVPALASRCGDVVLESSLDAWLAYPWWSDDARAPSFARSIDIHRKPGYDPLELFVDRSSPPPPGLPFAIPLDTRLLAGSHGAVDPAAPHETIVVCSQPGVVGAEPLAATDLATVVLKLFGAG